MNKRLPALLSAVLLSLFAVTALASAAAGDSAKGRGTVFEARFSFSAQGTGALDRANGNVTYTLTSQDPNVTITGDVTCMVIVGKRASIGGRITGYKPAGAAALFGNAQGFLIGATDNAKPSEGMDGFDFSSVTMPPPSCPTTFGLSPVITGDIEIIPGGP